MPASFRSPRPIPTRLLAPASALIALVLMSGSPVSAQDRHFSSDTAPSLGLSSDPSLGLPGVEYDVPFYGVYRSRYNRSYWHTYRKHGPEGYRRWYRHHYGYHWYPWYPLPQSEKLKPHGQAIYATPRLGLQYIYPYPNDIGLELPPDPEEPLVPAWPDAAFDGASPALVEALLLMKEGRYAAAGRLLAGELKDPPAPLDVYLVIAEVLVATGKHSAAAKVFRYGIEEAPTLDMLVGVNIAHHYPSREVFDEKMTALTGNANTDELLLLVAGFRLLSGDAAAMELLEELQGRDPGIAAPAKKLYLHFLDALFPPEVPPPAGAPAEKKDGGAS